jgi:hypothetical protein
MSGARNAATGFRALISAILMALELAGGGFGLLYAVIARAWLNAGVAAAIIAAAALAYLIRRAQPNTALGLLLLGPLTIGVVVRALGLGA